MGDIPSQMHLSPINLLWRIILVFKLLDIATFKSSGKLPNSLYHLLLHMTYRL